MSRIVAILSHAYGLWLFMRALAVLVSDPPHEYALCGGDTITVYRRYYVIKDDRTGIRTRYAGRPQFGESHGRIV